MAIFIANRWCSLITVMACLILCHTMQTAAVTHIVGDEKGWTLGFDYTAWAQRKQFEVGDTLVFNYTRGQHNVHRVNRAGFKNCTKETNLGAFTSGNDHIELTTAGRYWFICAVVGHCENGMKVVMTVTEASARAPAPQPGAPWPTSDATASHYVRKFSVSVASAMTLWLIGGYIFFVISVYR